MADLRRWTYALNTSRFIAGTSLIVGAAYGLVTVVAAGIAIIRGGFTSQWDWEQVVTSLHIIGGASITFFLALIVYVVANHNIKGTK